MAKAAAGEQPRGRRKLAGVFLACFCARRKKYLQLACEEEDETSRRRRNGPSTAVDDKPLRKIAEAFKELANIVSSWGSEVEVAAFSRACSFVTPLFGCIGFNSKFIEIDYVTKVLIDD